MGWLWFAAAAASLLVFPRGICTAQAQVRADIRTVATVVQFQRAVTDEVRHIIVTEHINMEDAQAELKGTGDSETSCVLSVKSETQSIVVRNSSTS